MSRPDVVKLKRQRFSPPHEASNPSISSEWRGGSSGHDPAALQRSHRPNPARHAPKREARGPLELPPSHYPAGVAHACLPLSSHFTPTFVSDAYQASERVFLHSTLTTSQRQLRYPRYRDTVISRYSTSAFYSLNIANTCAIVTVLPKWSPSKR